MRSSKPAGRRFCTAQRTCYRLSRWGRSPPVPHFAGLAARTARKHGGHANRVGEVAGRFRYPVKAMTGARLSAAEVDWHGMAGNRRLALRRLNDPLGAGSRRPEMPPEPRKAAEGGSDQPMGGCRQFVRSNSMKMRAFSCADRSVAVQPLGKGVSE